MSSDERRLFAVSEIEIGETTDPGLDQEPLSYCVSPEQLTIDGLHRISEE